MPPGLGWWVWTLGVGASRRLSAFHTGVASSIVVAWVLTIPLSAALAYVAMLGLVFP